MQVQIRYGKGRTKERKMDVRNVTYGPAILGVGNSGPRYLARTYEVAITRARGWSNLSTRSHELLIEGACVALLCWERVHRVGLPSPLEPNTRKIG